MRPLSSARHLASEDSMTSNLSPQKLHDFRPRILGDLPACLWQRIDVSFETSNFKGEEGGGMEASDIGAMSVSAL
jgi:hypothetical protein